MSPTTCLHDSLGLVWGLSARNFGGANPRVAVAQGFGNAGTSVPTAWQVGSHSSQLLCSCESPLKRFSSFVVAQFLCQWSLPLPQQQPWVALRSTIANLLMPTWGTLFVIPNNFKVSCMKDLLNSRSIYIAFSHTLLLAFALSLALFRYISYFQLIFSFSSSQPTSLFVRQVYPFSPTFHLYL